MKIDKKELEAYRARKREAKKSDQYKDMNSEIASFATSSAFYGIMTYIIGGGTGVAEYIMISESIKDPKFLFCSIPLSALLLMFGGGVTLFSGSSALDRASVIKEIKKYKEELINTYGTEEKDTTELKLRFRKFIDDTGIYSEM